MRRSAVLALVAIAAGCAPHALAARDGAASFGVPRRLAEKLGGAVRGTGRVETPAPTADAAPASASARDDRARLDRRVLVESPLNPWIQPTTFLRVALLMCVAPPARVPPPPRVLARPSSSPSDPPHLRPSLASSPSPPPPRRDSLSIRNAALDNPAAGFLQSILTTELAYTAFTNVFASFAAAAVQDFSQGLSNEGAVASEWVVDGETTLENVLASEFVYGGAWGFEQFYGFGFEISGDAAAALQQSLQPTWIPNDPNGRGAAADDDDDDAAAAAAPGPETSAPADPDPVANAAGNGSNATANAADDDPTRRRFRRRLLTDEEASRRNLPKGATLVAQVRKPLPGAATRKSVGDALARRKTRERRRRDLLEEEASAAAAGGAGGSSAAAPEAPSNASDARDPEVVVDVGVEEVTGSDVGDITTNWFDSFPAALPASIRDRLLAQLEEFVLNPQIAVSLEIAIALVGVVEPGQGIVSAEAADETTITYEAVLNGYDAAIDVAADIERGQGVAASASAGIAVSEAIIDAAEVIDAVTDIVDEVNAQIQADQARTEGGDDTSSAVAAQGSGSGANASATTDSNATAATPPKILAARNKAQPFHNLATATRRTAVGKVPDRVASARPLRVAAQGARRRGAAAPEPAPGPAEGPAAGRVPGGNGDGEYDYFGPTDYDYEPFGAVSGTYAVAVSLIFLEQISLNGGSITII